MTEHAHVTDNVRADEGPDDIAVVASGTQTHGAAPHEDVVRAIRYLLYRHELTSGSSHLPQMIAVVSASKGEGVTTVSQSLAHVLASERGTGVCWIDLGDAGSLPVAPGHEGLAELPGVGTPVHEAPTGGALANPSRAAIRLVPAVETPSDRSGEPLGRGPELDDLINGLAADYRHIIFDTPPLLSRVDSIGFLRHAEAYLLVTKQGSTTRNQVRTIAEELRPIPSLGAILNGHRTRTPGLVRRFLRE